MRCVFGRFKTRVLRLSGWVPVQILDELLGLKSIEFFVLHVISLDYLSGLVIVLPRLLRNGFCKLLLPLVGFLETDFVVDQTFVLC